MAVPASLIPGLAFLLFFVLPFGHKRWTEGSVCCRGGGEFSDTAMPARLVGSGCSEGWDVLPLRKVYAGSVSGLFQSS